MIGKGLNMPFPQVETVLVRLGGDIRTARIKRRIGMADMAARINVTRKTISKLEAGDPGVRIETMAAVLMVLGELHRLSVLLDPGKDDTGLVMEAQRLPSRVYGTRSLKTRVGADKGGQKTIQFDDEGTGF